MFNTKTSINFIIIFLEQAALSVQFVYTVDSAWGESILCTKWRSNAFCLLYGLECVTVFFFLRKAHFSQNFPFFLHNSEGAFVWDIPE